MKERGLRVRPITWVFQPVSGEAFWKVFLLLL